MSTAGPVLRHGGQEPRLVVVEEQNQSFVIVSTRFDAISNELPAQSALMIVILLEGHWLLQPGVRLLAPSS